MRRIALVSGLAKRIRGAKSFDTGLLHWRHGANHLDSWRRRFGKDPLNHHSKSLHRPYRHALTLQTIRNELERTVPEIGQSKRAVASIPTAKPCAARHNPDHHLR